MTDDYWVRRLVAKRHPPGRPLRHGGLQQRRSADRNGVCQRHGLSGC
jgi:hypothetical protein